MHCQTRETIILLKRLPKCSYAIKIIYNSSPYSTVVTYTKQHNYLCWSRSVIPSHRTRSPATWLMGSAGNQENSNTGMFVFQLQHSTSLFISFMNWSSWRKYGLCHYVFSWVDLRGRLLHRRVNAEENFGPKMYPVADAGRGIEQQNMSKKYCQCRWRAFYGIW